MDPDLLRLYLIADLTALKDRDPVAVVSSAISGGVTMVQLRGKTCPTAETIRIGRELKKVCQPKGVPLIINDAPEVAQACGACGVHLGHEDMPVPQARALLGDEVIIGQTVTTSADDTTGASYLGVGPVFPTASKTITHKPVLGIEGLKTFIGAIDKPAVAIGGINPHNAGDVMATGVAGIAVIGSICLAEDPAHAASTLIQGCTKV